ncbi:MAG: hypothetical protein LBG19_03235 [Prevotellaceae bacterium]|jgi:hypothetical protein|nr:hypothetical protein [Prevotellaceae bacterium]
MVAALPISTNKSLTMQKEINIQGIQRNNPDNKTPDGTCQEILNLRYDSGAWRPVGSKRSIGSHLAAQESFFVHDVGVTKNIISKYQNTIRWDRMDGYEHYPYIEPIIANVDANDKLRFDALGNVLVIFNETKQTMSWALWSPEDRAGALFRKYDYIEKLPDLPIFNFYPFHVQTTHKEDYAYKGAAPSSETEKQEYVKNHANAYMAKKRNEWYEKGWFDGYFFLVYAFELFDGTIIKHSNPIGIYGGNLEMLAQELNYPQNSYLNEETHMHLYVDYGGTMYVGCRNVSASALKYQLMYNVDLSKYKQIISSINIYISSPVNIDFTENVPTSRNTTLNYTYYPTYYKVDKLPSLNFDKQAAFYLLKRLKIDSMSSYLSEQTFTENLNHLVSQPTLSTDNNIHHTIYADSNKTYNSRLFLGDITTNLFNGWSLKYYNEPSNSQQVFARVILHTSDGVKTVDSDLFTIGSKINFPLIVSYPDTRAVRIDFHTPYSESIGSFLRITQGSNPILSLHLEPHPTLNIAYAVSPMCSNSVMSTTNKFEHSALTMCTGSYFSNNLWTYSTTSTGQNVTYFTSNQVNDTNRIQLSELNNPLYYPAKHSDYVGARVLGFSANSIPLSQGQFGQHPMLVFTEQSMYAMSIGIDPFIESITSLNGEVLSDKRNIINIGGATVFKTKEGLLLIEGSQVVNLSDSVKLLDNALLASVNSGFTNVIESNHIGKVDSYISRVPFLEYLTNAMLAYDSINREVIAVNSAYTYSYVLSLKHNYWYKRTLTGRAVFSDFPNFYLVGSNQTYQLNSESPSSYQVFLQTRPIDLEVHGFKKVARTILRGMLEAQINVNPKFGFYLFVSVDGKQWKAATGVEVAGYVRDIMLNRMLPSVRFISLVASGVLTPDSFISSITLDGEAGLNNKLR